MRLKTPGSRSVIVVILLICVFMLGRWAVTKETVVLRSRSPDGITASIVGYRDSLLTVGADLVVSSADGRTILRTNLLTARDAIADIEVEFIMLGFSNRTLHLESRRDRYNGPVSFTLP